TARVSVGAKSPLTRGIKESNAGGTFPLRGWTFWPTILASIP
ncbi:MAG TPA: hypothetical protein EYP06_03145, partial [Desulfobacterales bacterium]|nr:hypothetical protein [Desulfobacterales bacterium]